MTSFTERTADLNTGGPRYQLNSEEGVAIESSSGRLREGLLPDGGKENYIGKVQYVNYDTCTVPTGNLFYTFRHKRLSFKHERELRAIRFGCEHEYVDRGVQVPVSLEAIIERVLVSPISGEWFCQVVKSITEKFDLDHGLATQSGLYTLK